MGLFSKKKTTSRQAKAVNIQSTSTQAQAKDGWGRVASQLEQAKEENKEEWLEEEEGQLSVDVYQDKDNIIIKSTIAGVKPDIDISINNDLITIKGKREMEEIVKDEDYFYQECYWGSFSRSIILPVEVKADQAQAELKNGILTIILPKAKPSKAVSIKVKGE